MPQVPDPLDDLAPTTRFSDRAADYVRFRPDYPAAAIDHVLAGLGPPEELAAADVGAGTGISARLLAARGVRVVAIEPNREMRAAAEVHPRVAWRASTAESTGLAGGSVDLAVSAQAFHWFRQAEAIAELGRILKPGGRLAILWNGRDRGDPLTRGYIEAIEAVGGEHPAEQRPFDPAVVSAGGAFHAPALATFPHEQALDRIGLRGRATSASYVPKEGAAFEELVRRLDRLFDEHRGPDGTVTLRYRTEVWRAERR